MACAPVSTETLKRTATRLLVCVEQVNRGAVFSNKEEFHKQGTRLLKKVLSELGVDGDVRSCKGGPAVCGEVILHTDKVYVCLCVPSFGAALQFYFRTCRGRRDYSGGPNRWYSWEKLAAEPAEFVYILRDMTNSEGEK